MSLTVPGAAFYTGIDWAAETHAVCVMDAAGKVVARFTVAHSAEGLDRLVRKLAGLGERGDMPVAIERPEISSDAKARVSGGRGQHRATRLPERARGWQPCPGRRRPRLSSATPMPQGRLVVC
jgi:Transposase